MVAQFSSASGVEAPRCGQGITLGSLDHVFVREVGDIDGNGFIGQGGLEVLVVDQFRRAEKFSRRVSFFMRANLSLLIRPLVLSLSGTCTVM